MDAYLARNTALSKDLGHQSVFDVAEPSTLGEVLLGEEHVPETLSPGLSLELLHDDRCLRPSLLAFTQLCLVESICGDTLLLDELFDLNAATMSASCNIRGGKIEEQT